MNKIALITGATKGIGQAIAHKFIENDIYVIGTATSQDGANKISQELGLMGEGRVLNLSDINSLKDFALEIQKDYPNLSIIVNNAGITKDNIFLRMKDKDIEDIIDINLSAPIILTKYLLKKMLKNDSGRIINISSVVGFSGNPGQANYVSSKAGIIGFTKALSQEIASRNITVNAVAPGFIQTDMTNILTDDQKAAIMNNIPMKKLGSVKDIANAVYFLASDEASYITGSTIHVNGGLYM